jgi:peptide chain release factor 1
MSQLLIELRASEGGRDAMLFCEELRRVVFALGRHGGDNTEELSGQVDSRTLTIVVEGDWEHYEVLAGAHRVQRISKTDKNGRRHTATATIAVLQQGQSSPVRLRDADLDVYTYVGAGKGGQHRNKTATAGRIVHRPTGLVVVVEHGRSQWQNLKAAKETLSRRLSERADRQEAHDLGAVRNSQIASGERPLKQFTHNEQRATVTAQDFGVTWRWTDFYRGRLDRRDAG